MIFLQNTKMKTICFRTDCGTHVGWGHLARCKVLAEEFQAQGWSVFFASRSHAGATEDNFAPFQVIFIGPGVADYKSSDFQKNGYQGWLGVPIQQEADEFSFILQDYSPDVVFIDHYGIDNSIQRLMNFKNILLVDLQDFQKNSSANIIISYFQENELKNHIHTPKQKIYLGMKYSIIHRNYASHVRKIHRAALPRSSILLSLGTSPREYYDKMLQSLDTKLFFDKCKLTILSSHQSFSYNPKHGAVTHIQGVNQMFDFNLKFDLVIGSCGVAMLERIIQKIPCINFITVENQKLAAHFFKTCPIHEFPGEVIEYSTEELRKSILKFIERFFTLRDAEEELSCQCDLDSGGSRRIFSLVNSEFLDKNR